MSVSAAGIDSLYTVTVGDSLSKLAARFYGDAAKYPIIAQRNNINPASILLAGSRLIIPALPSAVEEVQITAQRLPDVTAPTGGAVVQNGIETITTTASVWYKDWRYWAGGAAVLGVLWYLSRGRTR